MAAILKQKMVRLIASFVESGRETYVVSIPKMVRLIVTKNQSIFENLAVSIPKMVRLIDDRIIYD